MGEVYRADDLKLGQPVALKFLPPDVDRDPARLTQLHTEVRMARQVSHPNVCRVYDIDEVDGHTFLSMEYVDGEDLASLLRRIGRFPEDRALEIARQICAGLAAAHERGVVHRDLKPANVMIDGAGRVRITDFGLAGLAGETIRAGTPAYMAPEQLAGGEVTARSDIYALGLVLYEIFTGQRALDGKNLAELIAAASRRTASPRRPRSCATSIRSRARDHALPRARPRPTARARRWRSRRRCPAAIRSPPRSPPVKRRRRKWSPPRAAPQSSRRARRCGRRVDRVSLDRAPVLYQRVMIINRVATPKTPEALQDRAVEALAKLGYGPSARRAWGLGCLLDYARSSSARPGARSLDALAAPRPETLYPLVSHEPAAAGTARQRERVPGRNPPLTVAGMTLIVVDASGRLASSWRSLAIQNEGDAAAAGQLEHVFEAAGLP